MAASPRLFPITLVTPALAFLQRFGSVLIIPGIFSHGPWVFTAGRSRQKDRILPWGQFIEAVCSSLRAGPLGTPVKCPLTWGCVPRLDPCPQALAFYSLGAMGTHDTHFLLPSPFT